MSIKKLKKIGDKDHPFVLHGNIDPLIEKVDELVDEINRLNEILDSNLIHKKDYSNINPYATRRRRGSNER